VWKAAGGGFVEDDFSGQLDRIEAPALIMWGDRDSLLPRSDQERMAAAIRQARLVVVHGAGHMLYWEEPERVAGELTAFVCGLTARRAPGA
jgi:pimeloyl-ACP methyl ester carboxylesterase